MKDLMRSSPNKLGDEGRPEAPRSGGGTRRSRRGEPPGLVPGGRGGRGDLHRLRAVIMAGGSGTRFWPLSRMSRPKQFLDIVSAKSMVEETVERLAPLVAPRDILTVADPGQTESLKRLLPGLPRKNFIAEPLARNTAPSLMLATARVWLEEPEAVVAALAADHLIRDPERFRAVLEAAALAASRGDHIVTFGIPPTFPSTGYGYIHYAGARLRKVSDEPFFPVLEFKEKPDRKTAEAFLADGSYLWNSGMFLWRADTFVRKLRRHAPAFYPFWERMLEALKKKDKKELLRIFKEIPALSIDYALMEKARGVLVTKGDFGWSDVGAWSSLFDVWPRDEAGNALRGETVALDSGNCLVHSPGKLTALIGVKDLIVVDTGDALLICRRDLDQKVKDVVEVLKRGRSGRL
jgi:mannose-1-phosphate guanylyltransferase